MEASDIEKRVAAVVADAAIEVEGADCDFNVTVISDIFKGMMLVKRQQMVLAGFTDVLGNGSLHALTVKPYTMDEWNNHSAGLVQISL